MISASQRLYTELLDYSSAKLNDFLHNYPLFPTQLKFDTIFNEACISLMYDGQRQQGTYLPRQSFWPKICGLKEICSSCWQFYLNPRNNSVKFLDIRLGKQFEKEFMGFLQSKGIGTRRGDIEAKNAPDIEVLSRRNAAACYLELKYLAAPYVKVHQFVKGRECYEGSTTLDTGKKIAAQRKIVETEIKQPVFYVYWLDYPCIKGVFFIDSAQVYKHIDSVRGVEWSRKHRSGDFITTGEGRLNIAQVKKVYLPLLSMGNFEELCERLRQESVKKA